MTRYTRRVRVRAIGAQGEQAYSPSGEALSPCAIATNQAVRLNEAPRWNIEVDAQEAYEGRRVFPVFDDVRPGPDDKRLVDALSCVQGRALHRFIPKVESESRIKLPGTRFNKQRSRLG